MGLKSVLLICLLFIITETAKCQTTVITRLQNVWYFNTSDSSESRQLSELAHLILETEKLNKHKIKGPILLDVGIDVDTLYELGYDNLYGVSVKSDIYEWKTWDYTTLGLRIRAYDIVINKDKVLALVNYGIDHFQQLVDRRNMLIKLKPEDRPKNTSINKRKIKRILKGL